MVISRLRSLLKDPVLVLTLCAMIASTLISFLLVNRNDHKVVMLESEVSAKKVKIRELTDNINQKYSNVSVLVLLSFVSDENDEKSRIVKEKYLNILPNLDAKSSVVEILESLEKERSNKFEEIDALYIDQVYLENQQYILEKKNKIYAAIATFLQVIGLVLIIVRKDFSADNLF